MRIKNSITDGHGSFYIEQKGKKIARMTYLWPGKDQLTIEHTYVNAEYEGKGLGRELVAFAVNFARTNHLKIIPVCPFTKKVIGSTPEYQDILYK
jgi:uncharacterized protein